MAHPVPRRGRSFWIGAAAGWSLIGYGLRGVLHHSLDTRPAQLARFWIGGALVHDLLLAPAVLAIGVLVTRRLSRHRRTVQRALIILGPLALFSYPEIRDYARILRNPTSLPHNYTANFFVVAGAVIVGVVASSGLRTRRRRPSAVRAPKR